MDVKGALHFFATSGAAPEDRQISTLRPRQRSAEAMEEGDEAGTGVTGGKL
jgi:hypothetical protein